MAQEIDTNFPDNTSGLITPAVQRQTLHDVYPYVGVKNYGAVGDGVTDDTAALQSMFALGPGTYVFEAGKTYLISDSLTPQSNTTIIGNGAVIQCPTAGWFLSSLAHYGFFVLQGVTDIRISGLHFYGTKTATQGADAGETHTPKFIFMNNSSRIWIYNNFFEHKDWEGIWPNDTSCSEVYVFDNVFSDIGFPSFGGLPAVQLAWNSGIVAENVFLNCGIAIGADGDGNLIIGNRILGIAGTAGISVSAELPVSEISLIGNNIEFTTAANGIEISGGVPNTIYVIGNSIKLGSGGSPFLTGIQCFDSYAYIKDNFIECTGTANLIGISALGSSNAPRYIIDGNLVIFKTNAGGLLSLGIQCIPNNHTVSTYVANNYVFGALSGNAAYDFDNAGGGSTTTFVCSNNTKDAGLVIGPLDTILAATGADNNRPYSYDTTQKISIYPDEISTTFLPASTVATLPVSPTKGAMGYVTDGDSALAWGAQVTNSGSGATPYLVWFNGTHWTVAGK